MSDKPRDPNSEKAVMTLWNTALVPSLQRKSAKRVVGGNYYYVDPSLPTLELSPSCATERDGAPALLKGRVYGSTFETNPPDYGRWYAAVTRWLRAHFVRNPVKLLGGYVGPAAFEWFRQGGVLLPMLEPPRTPEWLSFVESQRKAHSTAAVDQH